MQMMSASIFGSTGTVVKSPEDAETDGKLVGVGTYVELSLALGASTVQGCGAFEKEGSSSVKQIRNILWNDGTGCIRIRIAGRDHLPITSTRIRYWPEATHGGMVNVAHPLFWSRVSTPHFPLFRPSS